MGMFSWNTNDTGRSIASECSCRDTFTVYMLDDKGNRYTEERYEGYGVFGGKDYYTLLAEMNYPESMICADTEIARDMGIDLDCERADDDEIKWPNLVEDPDWKWKNERPQRCEFQGFFYEEEFDDDDLESNNSY